MKKSRSIKERIFALLLAIVMIAGIIPQNQLAVNAADGDPIEVEFQIKDSSNKENIQDFKIKISEKGSQNGEPIEITEEDADQDGKYVVELSEGKEYEYTVTATGYYDKKIDSFSVDTDNQDLIETINMDPKVRLNITTEKLNLKVGETKQLSVINSSSADNSVYEWFSDNESVAEVGDDGTVTAKGEGTTNVGIKFEYSGENGENGENKEISVSVPVEVSKYDTKVELTVDPLEGTDVPKVTLTAQVQVESGENTYNITGDDLGYVTFVVRKYDEDGSTVSNEIKITDDVDENGKASCTYNNNEEINGNAIELKGQVEFSATYNGNGKYNESSEKKENGTYADDKDIKVTSEGLNEDGNIIFENPNVTFTLAVEDAENRAITFKSINSNATVTQDGEVTVLNPGQIVISIKAEGNEYFNTSEITFTTIAQQQIKMSELEWIKETASKDYDGNSDIRLSANVPSNKIVDNQKVTYSFSGEFKDENVGVDKIIFIDKKTIQADGEAKYYSLDLEDSEDNDEDDFEEVRFGEIKPKEASLSVSQDVELEYGQDLKSKIEGIKTLVKIEGLIDRDEGKYVPYATLRYLESGYFVGKYEKVIIPGKVVYGDQSKYIEEKGTIVGNYLFKPNIEEYKDLLVEQQKIDNEKILSAIEIKPNCSVIATPPSEDKMFPQVIVRDGSVLQLTIKDDSKLKNFYDSVELKFTEDGDYIKVSGNEGITLDLKNIDEGLLNNVTIRLAKEGQKETYTKSSDSLKEEGNQFNYIYVDKSAPSVEFDGDLKVTALSGLVNNITFGFFKNGLWTQEIIVTEKPNMNNAGYQDSDVKSYVWKLDKKDSDTENTKGTELSYTVVKDKVDSLLENDWDTVQNNEIPILGNKTEIEEGYYVLFVKVVDQIGNGEIYVSNGMVFDAQAPVLTVTDLDNDLYGEDRISTVKDKKEELEGVRYTINIADPGDYTSAINRLEVKVTKTVNGEVTDSEVPDVPVVYDENQIYEDSYIINFSQDSYDLSDFDEWKNLTIQGIVTAEENVSTDVKVEIIAYDNAGNPDTEQEPLMKVTKEFQIDRKAPEINVSFDNNNVKNGEYFKEDRIMEIKYIERNLDVNDLYFDITLGEESYNKQTLDQMLQLVEDTKNGFVVTVEGDPDSPLVVDSEDSAQKTSVLKLRFSHDKEKGEDAEYTITPYCEDKAGNPNDGINYGDSVAEENFIIDKKEPQIASVAYSNIDGAFDVRDELLSDEEKAYSISDVEATVEIKEKNFSKDGSFSKEGKQFTFDNVVGVDVNDKVVVQNTVYNDAANDASTWTSDPQYKWTSAVEAFAFTEDANYTFTFTYTDLAGNSATYQPHYFTVDKTPAEARIIVDEKTDDPWESFLQIITFNIFKNSSYNIRVEAKDDTSGIASLEYYKSPKGLGDEESVEINSNWTSEGISGEKAEKSGAFTVSPDEQFVVYAKVSDYAALANNAEKEDVNHTVYVSTTGIVADNTEPKVTITPLNASEARNGIYDEPIRLRIKVEDPVEGDTYSGLKDVWYDINVTGNTTYKETIHLVEIKDQSEMYQSPDKRTYIKDIVIPATAEFNSNDIRVQAHATDFSNNTTHSSVMHLKMDITDPKINVTYNLNNPSNGHYYNATYTATVTVTERNFDPSGVRFNITNTDGVQPSISGWSPSGNVGVSDNEIHTCTVTFAADGDYTFTLNATDLAGRTARYGQVDEFTIDQTDPTIQVSYDNNNDAEPGYFNALRTATVTINEHNFNAADVNAMITASLQGSGASAPGLSGWTTRGDSHTATVTFSADADYTFDIDYTDLAGNAAADYTQDSFTIDQTAPEIEFFDITDKSANKGEVAPGVRYSDINYTESGVEITLTGANNGDESVDGIRSSIPNGQSIKLEDFAHEKEVDDLYTMTAVVTDRAGNDTEQSVMFSVNRFGSVYVMSTDTQELLDKVYTNEEQDLVVTEINVDSLVFNGISSGRDGNLTTLTEGEDYTVRESGAEDSWKQYTYTIDKENFETEGNYTVTIESEDQAENLSSTQVKKVQSPTDETQLYELEFAVDKTAPTVVLTGIEDGGQYRSNVRDVTVNTSDNIAMGDVKVYLGNSDEATTFSAEDIQAADGELTYTIPSSNTRQDIRAVATDAAGNTSETEINRVLVTSNLFVQFYSNTPLLAGSIAGVVVIAAALWYFLIFKRKKDEEKQANRR